MLIYILLGMVIIFLSIIFYILWKIHNIFTLVFKQITTPIITIYSRADKDNYLKIIIENIGLQKVENLKIKTLDDFYIVDNTLQKRNLKDITTLNEVIPIFNPKDQISINLGKIVSLLDNISETQILKFTLTYKFKDQPYTQHLKVNLKQHFTPEQVNEELFSNLERITQSLNGLVNLVKELKKPNNTISLN